MVCLAELINDAKHWETYALIPP